MKKSLVITLFLVLSSFFFISIKEVKADVTITDEDLSTYITEEILVMRAKLIEKGYKYVTVYDKADKSYKNFILDGTASGGIATFTMNNTNFSFTGVTWRRKDLSVVISNYAMSYELSSFYIVDSSFDIFPTAEFNIIYNDLTFNVGSNNKFYTLYDIYNLGINPPDPHESEKEVIANFYTICIDKLGYLGEQIVNNYVYLSMIVVLILVFIIELIRRWLM